MKKTEKNKKKIGSLIKGGRTMMRRRTENKHILEIEGDEKERAV